MFHWVKRLFGNGAESVAAAAVPALPLPVLAAKSLMLRVVLPVRRDRLGQLTLERRDGSVIAGPWPANGTAHPVLAIRYGNPGRDPLRPYGHVPAGLYELDQRISPDTVNYRRDRLGPAGALLFRPLSGPAAVAEAHGRRRLTVHGGPRVASAAFGSLRLPDAVIAGLIQAVRRAGASAQGLRLEIFDLAVDRALPAGSEDAVIEIDDGGDDGGWLDYGGAVDWYFGIPATDLTATDLTATDFTATDRAAGPSYPAGALERLGVVTADGVTPEPESCAVGPGTAPGGPIGDPDQPQAGAYDR
jgi:hypothetical protein